MANINRITVGQKEQLGHWGWLVDDLMSGKIAKEHLYSVYLALRAGQVSFTQDYQHIADRIIEFHET